MPKNNRYGILAGIVGGLIFVAAAAIPGAASFLFVLPLPYYIVGLSFGVGASIIGSLTSAALISIMFVEIVSGLGFLIMFGAPIVFTVYLALLSREVPRQGAANALQWYPLGKLLAWVSVWAGALFLFAYIASLGVDGGLKAVIGQSVDQFVDQNPAFRDSFQGDQANMTFEELMDLVALVAPAMAAISMMFVLIANFLGAQFIAEKMGTAQRPGLKLSEMELPELLALGFIFCLALTFFGGELAFVGGSIAAILFVPYIFVGLSVVHFLTRGLSGQGLLLVVFYAILFFVTPALFFVGMIGLAEQWLHLRRKVASGSV